MTCRHSPQSSGRAASIRCQFCVFSVSEVFENTDIRCVVVARFLLHFDVLSLSLSGNRPNCKRAKTRKYCRFNSWPVQCENTSKAKFYSVKKQKIGLFHTKRGNAPFNLGLATFDRRENAVFRVLCVSGMKRALFFDSYDGSLLQVLFPLLSRLLGAINPQDPQGIEETRMRGSTLLCKVRFSHNIALWCIVAGMGVYTQF